MSSVIRVRIGNFTQKYVQTLLLRSNNFKTKHKYCFHNSSFLYVIGQELKMPSLSPTMSEGTIVKWLKKEGDPIAPGDALCEIQTDKAVMSFETEEEGILAKILITEDTKDVKVGTLIALMVAEGEDWKSVEMPPSSGSSSPASSSSSAAISGTVPMCPATSDIPCKTVYLSYGPAVRNLLDKYDLKAEKVVATGNRNKLLKSDVLQFIASNQLKPVPIKTVPPPSKPAKSQPQPAKDAYKPAPVKKAGGFKDVEVTGMRRTIAKRLTESKTGIPHAYGNINCNIDKIIAMRKQLKSDGIALSVNDFIIKAVATALQQCPEVNTLWVKEQAVPAPNIDISVAVSTPTGLITPIVTNAAAKGLEEISAAVKSLAAKARAGKLQLHEFQGGSFTISNLGMFGVYEFSAIINPPQCAILAVGGGQSNVGLDGKPTTSMTITLSYDRRAIDEFAAAEFLDVVRVMLEEPSVMLLGGQQSLKEKLNAA